VGQLNAYKNVRNFEKGAEEDFDDEV